MEISAPILIHSYFTFGFSLFFIFQAFMNFSLIYRGASSTLIRYHFGLCLFSGFYSGISTLLVFFHDLSINLLLLHFMWMSGSLIMYFYIHSLKLFLKDRSKHLMLVAKLPLLSCLIVICDLLYWSFFGETFFSADPPFKTYNNIFMDHIGGMNPGGLVMFLGILGIIPMLYSSIYFLRLILKSPDSNKTLIFGVLLSFLVMTNDLTLSLIDPVYGFPFMFSCNFFEIVRITNHNQSEFVQRLSAMNQLLMQKSRLAEAGHYYSTLTHEIMNSLQAARGNLELFRKRHLKKDEPGNNYLDIVERQILRIEKLSRNVKRSTRDSFKLGPESVRLKSIYQHSMETIQLMADKNNVQLTFPPKDSGINVFVVEDELIQVFTNLITNAIEAMGTSDVRWVEVKESLSFCEKYVLISISDSGEGIPDHLKNKIWEERFTTKNDFGLGLGLYLCQEIIKKQNGSIDLSLESPTTEFIIKLPVV